MIEFASIEEAFKDFIETVFEPMPASQEKENLKHSVSRFRLNRKEDVLGFKTMKNILESYGYEVTTKTSKKNTQKVEMFLQKARNLQMKARC